VSKLIAGIKYTPCLEKSAKLSGKFVPKYRRLCISGLHGAIQILFHYYYYYSKRSRHSI